MLNRPVVFPMWASAMVALACSIVIVAGCVVAIALFTVTVPKHTPFTDQERAYLVENEPGGEFISPGLYRRCTRGVYYEFYAGGSVASYGQGCWR